MSNRNAGTSRENFQARRNMLKMGSCGLMTNATFLSTFAHLKMTNAVMASIGVPPTGGYKALVCLFFNGAIDSYNVLAPHGTTQGDAEYAGYASFRTGAALKRNVPANGINDGALNAQGTDGYLLPISDSASGKTYGLHQQFTNLQQIYNNGHATFVANTGPLHEPLLNNAGFANAAKIKPIGLYSHPDQQRHWQTAVPTSRNQVQGWAGKMLDAMTDDALSASSKNVYCSISLAGQTVLLTGNRIVPYSIGSVTQTTPNGGATLLAGYPSTANAYDRIFTATQNDLASQTYADVLERSIRAERSGARDAASLFQTNFLNSNSYLTSAGVTFPLNGLGSQLSAVARTIAMANDPALAGSDLKQDRQIFLVQIGGWDHHASLLTNQNNMVPGIDDGIKAFYDFLVATNMLNKVTLFSISDFARTLSFNGSGTDHGWGGNPLVMGGAVNGGRIYGQYPNFAAGGNINTGTTGLDRGRGVLIPTTSCDQYLAEICEWYGMPNNSNLVDCLPNIRNFYAAGGSHPIGFLNY